MDIRRYLLDRKAEGKIKIGFSYGIVWELIQDYDGKHRESRLARARCIHEFCDKNAFLAPNNISLNGGVGFSENGWWHPEKEHTQDIEELANILIAEIADKNSFNRKQRKVFCTVKGRQQFFRENPQMADFSRFGDSRYIMTQEFIDNQIFYKYCTGSISREIANKLLNSLWSDLPAFIISWFEGTGNQNPFQFIDLQSIKDDLERVRNHYPKIKALIAKHKRQEKELRKAADLYNELPDYLQVALSDLSPRPLIQESIARRRKMAEILQLELSEESRNTRLLSLANNYIFDVIEAYIKISVTDFPDRKISDSDMGDIFHACYLPHCDLWRGDISFTNLLLRSEIDHKEKIVPRLSELPDRIDKLLVIRGS